MASKEEKPYLLSWEDEAKWTALFSPIRSTTPNPEGLRSKLEFWKKCLYLYGKHTKSITFTCDEINRAFARDGRIPQCIPTVIEDMAASGEIFSMNDFLQMKPSGHVAWTTWLVEISKTPLHWAWKKVKNSVLSAQAKNLRFIHKIALEEKSEEILKHAADMHGSVIKLGDLVAKCKWPSGQLMDAMLAVHWLVCQKKAAVNCYDFDNPYNVLVKIANNVGSQGIITEKDICKYNLLTSIEQAEARIAEYDNKITLATAEARVQLRKHCKSLALCQLKKKKKYESIINQQADVLSNLHSLLETLNQSEANQEILETLKAANTAIKNLHKESNLNEDSVLEVMDDVRDTMEEQAEIQSALSQTVVTENNDDLESELQALIKEEVSEEKLCKFIDALKLPDVPEASIRTQVPEANAL